MAARAVAVMTELLVDDAAISIVIDPTDLARALRMQRARRAIDHASGPFGRTARAMFATAAAEQQRSSMRRWRWRSSSSSSSSNISSSGWVMTSSLARRVTVVVSCRCVRRVCGVGRREARRARRSDRLVCAAAQ